MIIAVNTRELSGNVSASDWLVFCMEQLANRHPEHQFIFVSDKEALNKNEHYSKNVSKLVLKQRTAGIFFWKMWYDYQLPALLKKIKADVLVTSDGIGSLRTKLPQCLIVDDLAFHQFPAFYSKKYLRFVRSGMAAWVEKARTVLVFSAIAKNTLTAQYKTDGKKIHVLPIGNSRGCSVLNQDNKERITEKFTDGKEYFLHRGPIQPRSELVNLLKAFSIFKKRQKSNMQLIIASSEKAGDTSFAESLRLYKYRDEVKLLSGVARSQLDEITAAAYACINLSPLHRDIAELYNAMEAEVPVIAGNYHLAIELLGDAAVFANAAVPENIADKLILLYKDESKRAALVQAGTGQAALSHPSSAADQLWEMILATIQSS